MNADHSETARHAMDGISYFVVLGVLVDLLPSIASALSIVWLLIQISQSRRFAQFADLCRGAWRRLRGR